MNAKKRIAIVLDGSLGSVLSLCKNAHLCHLQVFVICVDKSYYDIYSTSKYVDKVYYSDINELYLTCYKICSSNSINEKPLLYSTADCFCILINAERELFSQIVELCLPSSYIINNFCNKSNADIEARKMGLCVPKSIILDEQRSLVEVINTFNFPIILKPISVDVSQIVGYKFRIVEKKDFAIHEDDEWNKLYKNVICQEYIPGDDTSSWFYLFFRDDNGNVVECMGEKTMQSNGIMAIGTTLYNTELSEISRLFLNRVGYVGIGGIEYKKFDGKYYFIEMSTRTEGFLPISDMAGVSCAEASLQWYLYRDDSYKESRQKENIRYVSLLSVIAELIRKKSFKILIHALTLIISHKQTYIVEMFFRGDSYRKFICNIFKQKIEVCYEQSN